MSHKQFLEHVIVMFVEALFLTQFGSQIDVVELSRKSLSQVLLAADMTNY